MRAATTYAVAACCWEQQRRWIYQRDGGRCNDGGGISGGTGTATMWGGSASRQEENECSFESMRSFDIRTIMYAYVKL